MIFLNKTIAQDIRSGLVLSGGGAKGAYEAGVLLAISRIIKDLKAVSGASIGAINASFIIENLFKGRSLPETADNLADLWLSLKQSDLMKPAWTGYWRLHKTRSLFSTKPLEKILKNNIDPGRTFKDYHATGFNLIVPITNLNLGTTQIAKNNVIKAVITSGSFPAAFPTLQIGDHWYSDGGILANTPLKTAIRANVTEFWIIYLNQKNSLHERTESYKTALSALKRTIELPFDLVVAKDIKQAKKFNELLKIANETKDPKTRKDILALLKFSRTVEDQFGNKFEIEKKPLSFYELFPSRNPGGTFDFTNTKKLIDLGIDDGMQFLKAKELASDNELVAIAKEVYLRK
jgi:NTE family protein